MKSFETRFINQAERRGKFVCQHIYIPTPGKWKGTRIRERERERERERDGQTDRETDRERQTERKTEIDR